MTRSFFKLSTPPASDHRRMAAFVIAAPLVIAQPLAAAEPSSTGSDAAYRHAESHMHGAANLALALDGTALEIEFRSPAANIVGFEHPAETPEEREDVRAAIAGLMNGAHLFRLSGGQCTFAAVAVGAEGLLPAESAADPGRHHAGHTEFEASYRFDCVLPDELMSIEVGFFKRWPGIEEIDVIFVKADVQGSAEMTADVPRFGFE